MKNKSEKNHIEKESPIDDKRHKSGVINQSVTN